MKPRYQQWPGDIAEIAWNRGYLTPLELFRIAAWKSAKGLPWLSLNTETDIEFSTRLAMQGIRQWQRRQLADWDAYRVTAQRVIGCKANRNGLLGLNGVGYPMASAILCVLDPFRWPVIDKWAVRTVFGPVATKRSWQNAAVYTAYARHLVTEGPKHWHEDTIHDYDVRAQAARGEVLPAGWDYALMP